MSVVSIGWWCEPPCRQLIPARAVEDETDAGLDLAHRGRHGERPPWAGAWWLEERNGDVVLLAGFAVAELAVRHRCLAGPLVELGGDCLADPGPDRDVFVVGEGAFWARFAMTSVSSGN